MKRTTEISSNTISSGRARRAGYLAGAGVLALLLYVGLSVYAHESGHPEAQPEILASTLKFYPGGWQFVAINPATGGFRNVSNHLSADN